MLFLGVVAIFSTRDLLLRSAILGSRLLHLSPIQPSLHVHTKRSPTGCWYR
jgi:hypothetical protein